MSELVLALHLTARHLRVAVVDEGGAVLERRSERGPLPDDWRSFLRGAARLLARHCDHCVLAVPGRVDHRGAAIERSSELPAAWREALTEPAVADVLGVPVALAKDADVAAAGETFFGAAAGSSDVLYVALVPDVGVGVLLDRRVVHGRRSLVEADDLFAAGVAALAGERAQSHVAVTEGTILRARAGDLLARGAWDELVSVVQSEVTRLAQVFVPECVVLHGGPGLTGRLLLEPVRAHLRRRGPDALPVPIRVVRAALGEAAVLVGAAAWRVAFPTVESQLVGSAR